VNREKETARKRWPSPSKRGFAFKSDTRKGNRLIKRHGGHREGLSGTSGGGGGDLKQEKRKQQKPGKNEKEDLDHRLGAKDPRPPTQQLEKGELVRSGKFFWGQGSEPTPRRKEGFAHKRKKETRTLTMGLAPFQHSRKRKAEKTKRARHREGHLHPSGTLEGGNRGPKTNSDWEGGDKKKVPPVRENPCNSEDP